MYFQLAHLLGHDELELRAGHVPVAVLVEHPECLQWDSRYSALQKAPMDTENPYAVCLLFWCITWDVTCFARQKHSSSMSISTNFEQFFTVFYFSLSSLCSIPLLNLSFYRWEWNPGLHHFPPSLLRFDGSPRLLCVEHKIHQICLPQTWSLLSIWSNNGLTRKQNVLPKLM